MSCQICVQRMVGFQNFLRCLKTNKKIKFASVCHTFICVGNEHVFWECIGSKKILIHFILFQLLLTLKWLCSWNITNCVIYLVWTWKQIGPYQYTPTKTNKLKPQYPAVDETEVSFSFYCAQAFPQLFLSRNIYLPWEKFHQKCCINLCHITACGWLMDNKDWRKKKKRNAYRRRQDGVQRMQELKWRSEAQEQFGRQCSKDAPPRDGQTQHYPNFHFSVGNPRWLGLNDGYSNWSSVSPFSHDHMITFLNT